MATGTLEPIDPPDFSAKVPGPLLEMCGDSPEGQIRRYLLESQSVQEQQTSWLCRNAVAENKELREIESRVNKVESEVRDVVDWKNTLTGKGAIVGAAVFILMSAIVGAACKAVVDHLNK